MSSGSPSGTRQTCRVKSIDAAAARHEFVGAASSKLPASTRSLLSFVQCWTFLDRRDIGIHKAELKGKYVHISSVKAETSIPERKEFGSFTSVQSVSAKS